MAVDVLELRAHDRPDDADRRDRRARPVSASTPSRRSRSSSTCSAWTRRSCGHLPALRHGLRRRAADALRPHRQRVHPRPVGRPRAGGLRRAVLAPVRARPRRGARHRAPCSRPRASRSPARCSTSATRARTTASWTSWRRSASRPTAATCRFVQRTEDPRDYKVAFEKVHATARLRDHPDRAGGHRRVACAALDEGLFPDAFEPPVPQHPVTRALVTGGAGLHRLPPRRRAARPRRRHVAVRRRSLDRGHMENLAGAIEAGRDAARRATSRTSAAMVEGVPAAEPEVVYHLAAQIDVRRSVADPRRRRAGSTSAERRPCSRQALRGRARGASCWPRPAGDLRRPERRPDARDRAGRRRSARTARARPRRRPTSSYFTPPARAVDARAANGERLRPAPGPARRGGRGRDLLLARPRRAGSATCSATAAQTRDYVHCRDVVRARSPRPAPRPSRARSTSRRATRRASPSLARLLGLETELQPGRAGEILRSCLDPTAAAQALGWSAEDRRSPTAGDDPMSLPEVPFFDLRLDEDDVQAVLDVYRGLADDGPAHGRVRGRVREHLGAKHAVAVSSLHRRAPPRLPGRRRRPRRRGDRARDDVRRDRRRGRSTAARRRCSPTSSGRTTSALDPEDVERSITPAHEGRLRGALRGLSGGRRRAARALRRAWARADRGRRPRALAPTSTAASSAPSASPARSASSPTRCSSCGEGGLLATDDDDVAALARSPAQPGDDVRHLEPPHGRDGDLRRRRPRLQLPPRRAALGAAALAPGQARRATSSGAASSRARYRSRLGGVPGVIVPYDDASVEHSSCYVMPILRRGRTPPRRGAAALRDGTASRPASSIPPCTSSRPTASGSARSRCRTRSASPAREITLPLFRTWTRRAGPRRRRARGGARHELGDPAHRRRLRRGGPRGGRRVPALGLADHGAAHEGVRGGGRERTGRSARRRRLERHRGAAPRLRGARTSARATR